MKKYLIPLFVTAVLLSGCASNDIHGTAGNNVRIGAWNMEWFPVGHLLKEGEVSNPTNEARRISSASRFMRWQEMDVVMLEEMRDKATCEALVAGINRPTWQVNVCSEFPTPPEFTVPTHQNAIISRFHAVDSGFVRWKAEGEIQPPRGYSWAVLDINGELNLFCVVHLKSNYIKDDVEDKDAVAKINRTMREMSARQLVTAIDKMSTKEYNGRKIVNTIVGGDFNLSIFADAWKGERTIQTFLDAGFVDVFANVPLKDRYTMPETKWYPTTVFDYLLIKGPAKFSGPEVSIPQYTSDHQMVTVVLYGTKTPLKRGK